VKRGGDESVVKPTSQKEKETTRGSSDNMEKGTTKGEKKKRKGNKTPPLTKWLTGRRKSAVGRGEKKHQLHGGRTMKGLCSSKINRTIYSHSRSG